MNFLTNPEFWARWLGIVLIDLTLAGDNALVIALAVRSLPPKQQLWGRIWGTLGAVILRVSFIAMVTWLLRIPLLQLVGGLALIWIAFKLVRPPKEEESAVNPGTSLREAVGIIIVADVVMSLDNVIAISAAAHGDMVLVVFGLLLSLPLVVWGSGVLARLMHRFPWITWLGGGVLGFVAVEMMFKDHYVAAALGNTARWLHLFLSVPLAALIALTGGYLARGASAKTKSSTPAAASEKDPAASQ